LLTAFSNSAILSGCSTAGLSSKLACTGSTVGSGSTALGLLVTGSSKGSVGFSVVDEGVTTGSEVVGSGTTVDLLSVTGSGSTGLGSF